MTEMRTKRRYAHELYPHAGEFEVRPLEVEVRYLYARALGLDIWGTGWMERSEEGLRRSGDRTLLMLAAREKALLADALLRGMTGQEAWQWAEDRAHEESGEFVWQHAVEYDIDPNLIKPYPCGPEPDHHDHLGEPDRFGSRLITRIQGKESECPDCCEPIAAASSGVGDQTP